MILGFIQKLEMFSKCVEHKYGSKYVQVTKINDTMSLTDTVIFYLSVLLLNIFKQSNAERVKCNPCMKRGKLLLYKYETHSFPPYISTSISDIEFK